MPLRLLLLQLLPIVVFIAVDALVSDPVWAIVGALACVGGQALLFFLRERRLDRFVILDVLLIGGLGGASLALHDELLFKLKPAILEAVMVPFLLFLALAGPRVLQGYLGRYTPGIAVADPARLPLLRRMLGGMATLVLLHAGLVVWAALRWSRQAWAWVSGPGFYVLLVPMIGWALLLRVRARRAQQAAPTRRAAPVSGRRQRRG